MSVNNNSYVWTEPPLPGYYKYCRGGGGLKCLAQGHTTRHRLVSKPRPLAPVRCSTTEPTCSPARIKVNEIEMIRIYMSKIPLTGNVKCPVNAVSDARCAR